MTDQSVNLIFPEQTLDELSRHLISLTEKIARLNPKVVAHGALGGQYGYGARWDNDTFMMRPFCWCESEDCPWCAGCECDPDTTEYFIDGNKVTSERYANWLINFAGPYPHEMHRYGTPEYTAYEKQWNAKIDERNSRSREVPHPHCDFCTGRGIFAKYGATPGQGAPNFWHKPSGLKVWWYKWIGRDMKANGNIPSLALVFDESTASLKQQTPVSPETQ